MAGEDLTFLEPDPVARKILGVRLRQKRQQQQELLAKAFSEEFALGAWKGVGMGLVG